MNLIILIFFAFLNRIQLPGGGGGKGRGFGVWGFKIVDCGLKVHLQVPMIGSVLVTRFASLMLLQGRVIVGGLLRW